MRKGNCGEAGTARISDKSRRRREAGPAGSLRRNGAEKRPLAEAGEVKGDHCVLAVGREDLDLGVVGSNIFGVVFEPDEPAGETVGAARSGIGIDRPATAGKMGVAP